MNGANAYVFISSPGFLIWVRNMGISKVGVDSYKDDWAKKRMKLEIFRCGKKALV